MEAQEVRDQAIYALQDEITRLTAELDAMTSRYTRAAGDIASLEGEVEAWRCGRLLFHQGRRDYELVVNVGLTHDPKMTIHRFTTITDAVDALMAEREGK